jgi:hypothetical protein
MGAASLRPDRGLCLSLIALFLMVLNAGAVERLPLRDVQVDAFVKETQSMFTSKDEAIYIQRWPAEYFLLLLDEMNGDRESERAIHVKNIMKNRFVVAVAILKSTGSDSGRFLDFVDVAKRIKIKIVKNKHSYPLELIGDQEVAKLISETGGYLVHGLERVVEGTHFLIYEASDHFDGQLYSPYENDEINISYTGDDREYVFSVATIMDSLFKPRFCENGRKAHVTWMFDPWSGKKLPD